MVPRQTIGQQQDSQGQGLPPANGGRLVVLQDPACPGQALPAADLDQVSGRLARLLATERADTADWGCLRAVAVCPGAVVAAPLDGGQAAQLAVPPMPCGAHVERNDCDEYRACRYGYLCRQDDGLSILSPLWLDAEAMHLACLVLDDRPHPVTVAMLQEWADDLGVTATLDTQVVRDLIERLCRGTAQRGRYEIACGVAPVDAVPGRCELVVDAAERAGTLRDDGSMDFRDRGGVPMVRAGQLLARAWAGTPAVPGRDLRGRAVPGAGALDHTVQPGMNVRTERADGYLAYRSAIDGALRFEGDRISVAPRLFLAGDVKYETGNVDFDGQVDVDGSVRQGFSVTARVSVSVGGAVEPGASVTSQGDITVGRGIVGQRTRVTSGGSVRAQLVQEATISAAADVVLAASAYRATIQCGGRLTVGAGPGSRDGALVGGQAWARQGVYAANIGAPSQVATVVVAGVEPDQVQQLERLSRGVALCHAHVLRVLRQFDLPHIDVARIRSMIAACAGPRRRLLAGRARQLGHLASGHQELLRRKSGLERQVEETARAAVIEVAGTAHPGANIRIGAHRRVLDQELHAPHFHIAGNQLCER